MTDLIDTTEMYLRTILELEEENIVPLRARISERLGHSGPTVSQTINRMQRDDLVNLLGDRRLELTSAGRIKAVRVMRKHRLAECLLSDVIGLDWEDVHEEACRWEHVMSEQVERRIIELLNHPTESPYGNPIPGLEEFGERPTESFTLGVVNSLALLKDTNAPQTSVIRRLGEPIQVDRELLCQLKESGVFPGKKATFSQLGSYIAVDVHGFQGSIELSYEVASHIFVTNL